MGPPVVEKERGTLQPPAGAVIERFERTCGAIEVGDGRNKLSAPRLKRMLASVKVLLGARVLHVSHETTVVILRHVSELYRSAMGQCVRYGM